MIVKTFDNHVLLVTSVHKNEINPVKVIHISEFRNKKVNGYSISAIKQIIGTKDTHPEYLL